MTEKLDYELAFRNEFIQSVQRLNSLQKKLLSGIISIAQKDSFKQERYIVSINFKLPNIQQFEIPIIFMLTQPSHSIYLS